MTNEQTIRAAFAAYMSRDWPAFSSALAEDFTFTSPYDDHIGKRAYKERCWAPGDKFASINVDRVIESGNEAFARYSVKTKDGKAFTNTEYYRLEDGKIKSIEVYFGDK